MDFVYGKNNQPNKKKRLEVEYEATRNRKRKLGKLTKKTNYIASPLPLLKYETFKENKILKGKKCTGNTRTAYNEEIIIKK